VLQKLSDEIREFYRLAEQARQWAEEETDTSAAKDLRLVALSWLRLACMQQQAAGEDEAA